MRQWRRRRDSAAGWLALAFLTLGVIVTVGRFVPSHPHGLFPGAEQRIEIELLVLFPYLVYRFAAVFAPPPPWIARIVLALTGTLTVWTFAIPYYPSSGQSWPAWFVGYVVAFLVHWAILSAVVATQLWRAGRGQPGVAGKRMRLLALAAVALTLAIILSALERSTHSVVALVGGLLGSVAGLAFLLGLAPPQALRASWRIPEQRRLQEAIRGLMTLATTRTEIAERVIGPATALVGARAAAIRDADGVLLATRGVLRATEERLRAGEQVEPTDGTQLVTIDVPSASFLIWTSRYAPFFGEDELSALHTTAALTGIALDRVRLFEQEHAARVGLERANEVMADFIALAAHELRTPVTTIHGFVQTLNHVSDRLTDAQTDELRAALEQQTTRMASLVEQLLDLSRLDAEAVQVRPEEVQVDVRLREVVAVAAAGRPGEVRVEVPDGLCARLDPSILDHIVSNLVTNAFRYGVPPVVVTARAGRDGGVEILVEDEGPGVAPDLTGTLFERFTRGGVSRDRVAGTGLGLAIARAYARAHLGDIHYESCEPTGARFVVDLPSV